MPDDKETLPENICRLIDKLKWLNSQKFTGNLDVRMAGGNIAEAHVREKIIFGKGKSKD